jgi:hypothetical protein
MQWENAGMEELRKAISAGAELRDRTPRKETRNNPAGVVCLVLAMVACACQCAIAVWLGIVGDSTNGFTAEAVGYSFSGIILLAGIISIAWGVILLIRNRRHARAVVGILLGAILALSVVIPWVLAPSALSSSGFLSLEIASLLAGMAGIAGGLLLFRRNRRRTHALAGILLGAILALSVVISWIIASPSWAESCIISLEIASLLAEISGIITGLVGLVMPNRPRTYALVGLLLTLTVWPILGWIGVLIIGPSIARGMGVG